MQVKKVVVIGGGFGGLSAAAYLARDGYDVTLLEKNARLGGRAIVTKNNGFIFDMGPSWYLMPDVFEEFFADFGHRPNDFYKLVALNPSYKVFETDQSYDVPTVPHVYDLFEKIEPGSSAQLKVLLRKTKSEYDTVRKRLLTTPQVSFTEAITHPEALKFLLNPELTRSYHSRIQKYVRDPKLQHILEFMTVFMGGSPKNIPAMYSLLTHVDMGLGVQYPLGGMGKVVDAFVTVAKEQGVKIRRSTTAQKIITKNGKITGVKTAKDTTPADIVVANADYWFVETVLLGQKERSYSTKFWHKSTPSPSGLLMYLGVNKKVPKLRHHNLFFDSNWNEHFNEVFKRNQWSDNPLFYVSVPSKTDDSVAPKANENMFVLAPMASGVSPTQTQLEQTASNIMSRIEQATGTNISDNLVVKDIRTSSYFEQTFNAYKGNAFGLAHTWRQSGPLRPKMRSKKVNGLYFAGQYTNPGTGVPLVVLSGKAVGQLIKHDA